MSCYAMLRCSIMSYVLRCNATLLRNRILCGVVIRNAVAQYALQSLEGSPVKRVCLFLKGFFWGVLKVQVSGRGGCSAGQARPPLWEDARLLQRTCLSLRGLFENDLPPKVQGGDRLYPPSAPPQEPQTLQNHLQPLPVGRVGPDPPHRSLQGDPSSRRDLLDGRPLQEDNAKHGASRQYFAYHLLTYHGKAALKSRAQHRVAWHETV